MMHESEFYASSQALAFNQLGVSPLQAACTMGS